MEDILNISNISDMSIVPSIMQPEHINIPLFLHQLKSIEEMQKIESNKEIELLGGMYITTKLGVLGDLPGYGKTLSMLGLISNTKDKNIDDNKYIVEKIKYHNYVQFKKIEIIDQLQTSLILSNLSLVSQWINELNRTSLRYLAIYKQSDLSENINLSLYDVVLVSSNIFNLFAQVYKKKCWKRFIIDEPASLKMSMEEVYANFYWLVTGTPKELYTKRLHGFLKDLIPEDIDIFNYTLIKNDDNIVKNSYRMPHTRNIHYKYKDDISQIFMGLVPDNVIEMIQSNNISGVLDLLNGNIECTNLNNDDQSISSYSNVNIYDAFKNKKKKRLEELYTDRNKNFEKIQVVEYHINQLSDRINKLIINGCLSCNEKIKDSYVITCCQRIYCGNCINGVCIFCKSDDFSKIKLELKNQYDVSDEFKNNDTYDISSLKMNIIMDIIGDCSDKKILIFSNYNETFSIIKRFLDEKKLNYLELKGTKEKRDNTIDSYKSGNVNILLLNTIHSGAGLNLQETSDIILCHKLHEYQKIQVIGRANRIGRKIELNIHYLD